MHIIILAGGVLSVRSWRPLTDFTCHKPPRRALHGCARRPRSAGASSWTPGVHFWQLHALVSRYIPSARSTRAL